MHEVTLRREMLAEVKNYRQHPRPEGSNVRPMTGQEVDQYTTFVADVYHNLELRDNQNGDTDSAPGCISASNRSVDNGITDSFPRETKEDLSATFGGRSKALEMVQDISNRPLYDTNDPGSSSTDAMFAEQNVMFITGISLRRDGDTVSGTSFYIDRLHPENSVISERQAATAREI